METIATSMIRRIGRCLRARPAAVVGIMLLVVALSLAVCLLRKQYQRAEVTFLVRTIGAGTPDSTRPAGTSSPLSGQFGAGRWVSSETVLARTLLIIQSPDGPAAAEWRTARALWEAEHSQENWAATERALHLLDSEADRYRKDPAAGPTFSAQIARFRERIHVIPEPDSRGLLTLSVLWPVRAGGAAEVARTLGEMARDRVQEIQTQANREAADLIRLRRESLRQAQLLPAESALQRFVERELDAAADLVDLDQLSRSAAESNLAATARRLQQDAATVGAQLEEARRLRNQTLASLPAVLWNGSPRRDANGDLTGPDVSRLSEKQLPDDDPILGDLSVVVPAEIRERNVVLSKLKVREAELLVDLNRIRAEFNLSYQGLWDKRTELIRVRREILTQVIGEAAQLQVSIAGAASRRQELQQGIEEVRGRTARLTPKVARYQQLCHEVDVARKQYLKTWMDETDAMQSQERGGPLTVLQMVDLSVDTSMERSVLSNPWRLGPLAVVAGVVAALVYALVAGALDRTFRWPDEVERSVGLPVVGRIGRLGRAIVS
jgi:hypothetical protein